MSQIVWSSRPRGSRKSRLGERTQIACVNCKERKQKCDSKTPSCSNCRRLGRDCLVEDPVTKRQRPRNYLETLEARLAALENVLELPRSEDDSELISGEPDLVDTRVFSNASELNVTNQQSLPARKTGGNGGSTGKTSIVGPVTSTSKEDETIEDSEELSSKAGLLSVNAPNAEPHYFGSSSAYALSRIVNPYLRRLGRNTRFSPVTPQQDRTLSTPCVLPGTEGREWLSRLYFEQIHPQHPFLHEPSFREWESAACSPEQGDDGAEVDHVAAFFVNMVYAIGRLMLPWNAPYSNERLFAAAQLHLDHIIELNSLETVQAMLMCAVYALRSCHFGSVWAVSGMAVRLCVELGFHRNTKKLGVDQRNPVRIELGKRAFWCAYDLDRSVGMALGRPFGIADSEIDAEYPADVDDKFITLTGLCGIARTSSTHPPTRMSAAIHMFKLRRIWSQIHDILYSCNQEQLSSRRATILSEMARVHKELDLWRQQAPRSDNPNQVVLSAWTSGEWFELAYNHSILLLFRTTITHSRQTSDKTSTDAFLKSAEAAQEVCNRYRRIYLGYPVSYTWGALHIIFVAGLTYLHCLWSSCEVRKKYQLTEIRTTCTACTVVLMVIAERFVSASSYQYIFEELATRTLGMLATDANNNSINQFPSDPTSISWGLADKAGHDMVVDSGDLEMPDEMGFMLSSLIHDVNNWEETGFDQIITG